MADFIKFLMHGYAPDVIEKHLIVAPIGAYTKGLITQAINRIIDSNKGKTFKIGKTGDAEVRADQVDYRTEDFDKMYLLYQHTNPKAISELEEYYINMFKSKYPRRSKNIQLHSGGGMVSKTAYYYLYVVI